MASSRLIGVVLAIVLLVLIFVAVLQFPQGGIGQKLVRNLSDHYLLFIGAVGAVSTLTRGVIETIKDLVPVLRWYHQAKTRYWLLCKAAEVRIRQQSSSLEASRERLGQRISFAVLAPELRQAFHQQFDKADDDLAVEAEADLLRLATAGNRTAFYDLPIEQLCELMNAASQVVLDYPDRHSSLLKCLASLGAPADLSEFQSPTLRKELTALRNKSVRGPEKEERLRQLQQHLVDIRGRVANQIHQSIHAFQIAVGDRWKWYLRIVSFLLSFTITACAIEAGVGSQWIGSSSASNNMAAILLVGLMVAFLAPFVSDLPAVLQQIKGKS